MLLTKRKIPFTYNKFTEETVVLREPAVPYQFHKSNYKENDIDKLSEGTLAELIDGKLYMMGALGRIHQSIVTQLIIQIGVHIQTNKGKCQIYPAPFDVRLFKNNKTIVQPDVSVICNTDILTDKGCDGTPDWVIEIALKSNSTHDYITKLMQYQKAGVHEYWIIDPEEQKIHIYNFKDPSYTNTYNITDKVPSGTLKGLIIELNII